jgi:hypothetical protein
MLIRLEVIIAHGELIGMLAKPFTPEEEAEFRYLQRKYFRAWRDRKRERRYAPRFAHRKDKGQNGKEETEKREITN